MNNLTFVVGKDKTFYDVSQFVIKAVWSGRRGKAARTIEVTLMDSETFNGIGTKINVGEGQTCVLYDTGANITLFQGLIMSERYNTKRQLVLKAYDVGVWLSNNKDSFTYNNKTADQIVRDCLSRLNIPAGTIEGTGFVIGELVKKGTTYWDVIEDALSQTYLSTGKRYYVYSSEGRVHLILRKPTTEMPIIELQTNVEQYDYTRSIENTRTRLKMVTGKGTVKRTETVDDLEKKIGVFQEFESVDEKISDADLDKRAKEFRTEKGIVGQTLTVTVTGYSRIKSGSTVYVRLDTLDIKRMMYVEEDTHTFENGKHTMKLTMSFEAVKNEQAAPQTTSKKKSYKVGDVVNFHGGTHYVSSYPGARGYKVSAGPAKITIMNGSGKAHPWCLVTTDWSKTHVWGWVDDGTFD